MPGGRMPQRPDLPCADCGKLMWRVATSLPEGQARCHPCRRANGSAARKAASKAYRSTPIPCFRCEQMFTPTKTSQKYWSGSKEIVVHAMYAGKDIRPRPVGPIRKRWFAGRCRVCSTAFVSPRPEKTCSDVCTEAAKRAKHAERKQRRRARERAAYISPVNRYEVFERDAWTCQLCNEPVERDKVVPHPKVPTIDHVIPLARGGTHEMANVQTACFLCNATKSDRMDWSPALMA